MLDFTPSPNNNPVEEKIRLQKLLDYEILDTPAENGFNYIAQLAKGIFAVDYAFVAFVDAERIFFKADANHLESSSILKDRNFLSVMISQSKSVVFDDGDDLTSFISENKLNNDGILFYAGTPIITKDGYFMGTVCVAHKTSIKVTEQQLELLRLLPKMVLDKLDTRLAIRNSFRAHDDRLHMLVHDLKNPMTTISLQSELAGRLPGAGAQGILIANKINHQAKMMIDNLNFILSTARKEKETFKMQKVKVDLKLIIDRVLAQWSEAIMQKKQTIHFNPTGLFEIYGDENKLSQIVSHLIDNAIKFSNAEHKIEVDITSEDNLVTISIKDYGEGLSTADLDLLFVKFAKLGAAPTAFEDSNGLGLLTVKMLVDMHKGKVWAESEGQNLGTTFYVALPIK